MNVEKAIVMFLQDKDLQNVKNSELWNQLSERFERKHQLLIEQVNELKNVNYNIDLIYLKNDELKLEDSKL